MGQKQSSLEKLVINKESNISSNDEGNYILLDFLRGISAILVVINHIRPLLFSNVKSELGLVGKLFIFVTGFGHQSVIIFFILSGFFISKSVLKAIEESRWTFKKFLIDRLSRLWVVLIPALIIGGVIDYVGLIYLKNTLIYSDKIPFLSTISSFDKLSFYSFFGNIFFMQNILTHTFGSNSPLWSLSNEFWYYILFPCIVLSIISFKKKKILSSILYFITSLLIIIFIGLDKSTYFLIWLGGALVYKLHKQKEFNLLWSFMATSMFLATLVLIRFNFYPKLFNDYSLGLSTALLVFSICRATVLNRSFIKFTKHLSSISFSLYVFHFPFILFLVSFLGVENRIFTNIGLLYFALVFILSYAFCYSMWFLFERNTIGFKNKLLNLLY